MIGADSVGYVALASWAEQLGRRYPFGIEGTGSYGVGLASFLRRRGYKFVEVDRSVRGTLLRSLVVFAVGRVRWLPKLAGRTRRTEEDDFASGGLVLGVRVRCAPASLEFR
jgi:hypothetical protein